jgi:putative transposase
MIANSARILPVWQQPAASRSFERRTELRERMPDDERFLGSVRRECLDHFLILHEKQLYRLLKPFSVYFNQARPHQGLGQRIPDPPVRSTLHPNQSHKMIAVPVLGGLHHDYQRIA